MWGSPKIILGVSKIIWIHFCCIGGRKGVFVGGGIKNVELGGTYICSGGNNCRMVTKMHTNKSGFPVKHCLCIRP